MKKQLKIALIAVGVAIIAVAAVFLGKWAMQFNNPAVLDSFKAWIESFGALGFVILFVIQYLQVLVAFIPGVAVQVAAGALFGIWGGLVICIGGTILSTATIFFIISKYGKNILPHLIKEKDAKKYEFLTNESKLELLVLVLYFIPGTPKDVLTYIFSLTRIKFTRFIILSTLARTPAITTSLIFGNSVMEGNYMQAVVVFVVMTALAGVGYFVQKYYRKKTGNADTKETTKSLEKD